jgi:hypothetical protein
VNNLLAASAAAADLTLDTAAVRAPRCTIGLSRYRRVVPYGPTPAALAGALDIYSEGRRGQDVLRMLFGLSILRSASPRELDAAIGARASLGRETAQEFLTLLATDPAFDE